MCQVRQDQVELPNGKIIDDYFVNIKPDIAIIFPITEEIEVILIPVDSVSDKIAQDETSETGTVAAIFLG